MNDSSPETVFHSALRRLLRPLIKAFISRGMIFPTVVELLRELYVDVAKNDFLPDESERTLSRISLMTGVTRREVKRLIDWPEETASTPRTLSLGSRIMTVWLGDDAYLDQNNEPLPLPLTGPKGEPSLDQLVASVSKDVRARAVLEEWLRLGLVDMSGTTVRLKKNAFIPEDGYEEKIFFFGRNLRDHIAAGVHNLEGLQPPFFDRAVYYNRLSSSSLETLRKFTRESGAEFLLTVNRKARQLANQDESNGNETSGRVTLGLYYYDVMKETDQKS